MKRSTLVLAFACMVLNLGFGQARQPVLRVSPFGGSGVGDSEASTMERLVASYIVELKAFRVFDSQGQELALSETETALNLGVTTTTVTPLAADYVLSGTLGKIGEIYVFTLDATKVSNGEKLSVSDTALALSDIVLRSRDLTRSLFDRKDAAIGPVSTPGADSSQQASAAATSASSTPSWKASLRLSDISGSWRGDKGLETVRVFSNSTGLAVLTGGGTLKIRIAIQGDMIEILQDQPNDPNLYRSPSVTFEMARRIAAQARPMRWLFRLDAAGQTLVGTKESIAISGSGSELKVDNTYVRDASWSRISR